MFKDEGRIMAAHLQNGAASHRAVLAPAETGVEKPGVMHAELAEAGIDRRHFRTGRRAEDLAALYLRLRGFTIVARRFRARSGEADIIARRGRLLVFAEVKARASLDEALFAVTFRNRARVSAAAAAFVAHRPAFAACDIRYDIIAVKGWRIRHIPAAWRDGE